MFQGSGISVTITTLVDLGIFSISRAIASPWAVILPSAAFTL